MKEVRIKINVSTFKSVLLNVRFESKVDTRLFHAQPLND